MGKFEVYQSEKNQEFRFRLLASNGQNILSSEGYSSKTACLNGVESVKKNGVDSGNFEKSTTPTGLFRFSLKAKNGQIVGTSQNYKSEKSRDNGVESVGRNADGDIVDLT